MERCVNKFARFNQSMMSTYVEVQTEINQKRLLEAEQLTAAQTETASSGAEIVAPVAGNTEVVQ